MVWGEATCGHDGGTGIGAGHKCICIIKKGHDLSDPRPHGCSCGAMWADKPMVFRFAKKTTEIGYVVVKRAPKDYVNKWLATDERSTNRLVVQNWVDSYNNGRDKTMYKLGVITIEEEEV